MSSTAAKLAASNSVMPVISRPIRPRYTARTRSRGAIRGPAGRAGACRSSRNPITAATSPGTIATNIAERTPSSASVVKASSGPATEARWCMPRSNPNARP